MDKAYKTVFWILIIVLSVVTIVFYIWRLCRLPFASSPEAFGVFGDYIGGVFGAFTGLVSVIFLYLTYGKQIEIFREQKRQMEEQQSENNFFHLLENFMSLQTGIRKKSSETKNKSCVAYVRGLIEKEIDELCETENAFSTFEVLATRTKIDKLYQDLFPLFADILGHYFRSLYHLLKYIDNHFKDNKKDYSDLVQAQLNTDELYLTCINGLSSYGRKKLHPLLDKFSFLENLAIDENENIRKLVYFYYPNTKKKNITGVRNNVVIIAGTEGVGKGKFIKRLKSEIIAVRFASVQGMLLDKGKNPSDLLQNQNIIKEMIEKTIDPDENYVICCNFCQLYSNGTNQRLPLSLYEGLHPIAIVLLVPQISEMIRSIRSDDKINLDDAQAELYLENEEQTASDYADKKNVPLYRFGVEYMDKAMEKIKQLLRD